MRILIIEDKMSVVRVMIRLMKSLECSAHISYDVASTADEVSKALEGVSEKYDGIILDACLNLRGEMDTYFVFPILKRNVFKGIVLPNSMESDFNEELIACGATHRRLMEKSEAMLDIIQIFVEMFFSDPRIPQEVVTEVAKMAIYNTGAEALVDEIKGLKPGEKKNIGLALIQKMKGEIPDILKTAPMEYFADLASDLIQGNPI